MARRTRRKKSSKHYSKKTPIGRQDPIEGQNTVANQPKNKRPTATLDLKATEIEKTEAATPNADKQQADKDGADTDKHAPEEAAQESSQKSSKEAQKDSQSKDGGSDRAHKEEGAPEPQNAKNSEEQDKQSGQYSGHYTGLFTHLAAGIAGGFAVLLAAHWISDNSLESGNSAASGPLAQKLAALEQKINASDLGNIEQFGAQLKALEQKVTQNDIAQKQTTKQLAQKVEQSDKARGETAQKISRLEAVMKSIETLENTENQDAASSSTSGTPQNAKQIAARMALLSRDVERQIKDLKADMTSRIAGLAPNTTSNTELTKLQTSFAALEAQSASFKRTLERLQNEQREGQSATQSRLLKLGSGADIAVQDISQLKGETSRLRSAMQSSIGEIKTTLSTMQSRTIAPLNKKLGTIEQKLAGLVAREKRQQSDAQKTALAIALANLKRAIDRGEVYQSELGAVRALAPKGIKLDILARHQKDGVPTQAGLERSFRSNAVKALDAESASKDGSVLGQLLSNARTIVRVRRTGDVAGETSEAILARIEQRVKKGDMPGALREAKSLKGAAAKAFQTWQGQLAARLELDGAMRKMETELLAALGGVKIGETPNAARSGAHD